MGRPPKGVRSSERHEKRAALRKSEPVHVAIRTVEAIRNLRNRDTYHAIRKALVVTFLRTNFRIVHVSLQHNHVHLIVEADDRMALARGMQAFQISAAKHLNAAVSKRAGRRGKLRRRGMVFADRYHAVILRSPRQTRNALAYVLNNWRKHRADRGSEWRVDPYSSAVSFDGWRDLGVASSEMFPAYYARLPVWKPRTWLLRTGWRRHGLIRPTEVPSEEAVVIR